MTAERRFLHPGAAVPRRHHRHLRNIPWDYSRASSRSRSPARTARRSTWARRPSSGKTGQWPTTKKPAFTAWKPPAYGHYTVTATGWIADIWGNRYEGGGTYRFWIAKRMTLATATFQGQAYPVGNRYGRDMASPRRCRPT